MALTNSLGRRPLRSFSEMIDRRVEGVLHRTGRAAGPSTGLEQQIEELRKQLGQLQDKQRSLELLLDGTGRGTARTPTPAQLNKLADQIAAITGDAAAAKRNVYVGFRLLVAVESLGVGRIAGSTMNICGKLATTPLLDAPNDDVLEIGTLYGLFAAALLRMLERLGRDPQLTVVDPLIGAQHQTGATMRPDASGTPVREAAVRTNLSLAGEAGAAARIQVGYSTDPDTRAAVGDRSYGVVIVDGDHSYEGVATDLDWAEEIAAPGGIVVLDDYGDDKWRGVQQAVDEHLAGGGKHTRFTLLGRVSTSGYLRAR